MNTVRPPHVGDGFPFDAGVIVWQSGDVLTIPASVLF